MRVFKYCNENGILILENSCIKFLDVTKSNDPFDCMPSVNSSTTSRLATRLNLQPKNNLHNIANQLAKQMGFNKKWIKKKRKMYFEQINRGDKFHKNFTIKEREIYLLSLTTNYNSLLMWSHYANEHKGLLIEFETDGWLDSDISKPNEMLRLRNVEYRSKRPIFNPSQEVDPSIYLVKDESWKYEAELRVFLKSNSLEYDPKRQIFTYNIQPKSIKTIVLGCNASGDLKKRAIQIKKSPNFSHLKLKQSKPDPIHFKFNYEKIKL